MNLIIMTTVSSLPLAEHPAYLDPGSGSFILQLILAAILGSLVVFRSFWTKIKDFILNLFNCNPAEDDNGKE